MPIDPYKRFSTHSTQAQNVISFKTVFGALWVTRAVRVHLNLLPCVFILDVAALYILLVHGITDYPRRSADSQRLIIPPLVSQFSSGLWYLSSPDRTIGLSTWSLVQSVSWASGAGLYGFLTKAAPSLDETTVVETQSSLQLKEDLRGSSLQATTLTSLAHHQVQMELRTGNLAI